MKSVSKTTLTVISMVILASCGKKHEVKPPTGTDFSKFYITGIYNGGVSKTDPNLMTFYAIVIKADGKATWIDPMLGQNDGTYAFKDNHLMFTFNGGNLYATLDFTVTNNKITALSADGLDLRSYKLDPTPAVNVFAGHQFNGTFTSNTSSAFDYLTFSATAYNINTSASAAPTAPYSLLNNAVAVFEKGEGLFVYDNTIVNVFIYQPPLVINGNSLYTYGSFAKVN